MKKKAVLLDVSAIMFRAYYGNQNFRTKNEPTGAIYGFTNTLLKIINEFSPNYICAAFDVKRKTLKRSEKYSGYKANRDAVPEDLLSQIPRIEELLDDFNINRYKVEGYEADDVLGTLANNFSKEGIETIVVTGDKDLAQILDENIKIALLKTNGLKVLRNDEDVIEHLGVKSSKITELFGLIGDTSDGIPGIRKVGPKKAIPMIEKYGNLETIYEHVDELTELPGIGKKLVDNIVEDREMAFLSRDLATIHKELPIDFEIEKNNYHMDKEKLYEMFKELEFKNLIKKLDLEEKEDESEVLNRGFYLVNDKKSFEILNSKLKNEKLIAIYYTQVGIAISSKENDFYYPFVSKKVSKIGENISLFGTPEVKKEEKLDIQNFFDGYKGEIVTYNLKKFLNQGYKIKNCKMDAMIGYHLITSTTKEDVELPILNLTSINLIDYATKFGREKIENVDENEFGEFATLRSYGILKSYPAIQKELEEKDLLKVINEVEMPLILILSKMERRGIMIDPEYFEKYGEEMSEILEETKKEIYGIAGTEFNINSPKQLSEILFFTLNLEPVKKTKTGYSTNEEVLETLKSRGAVIASHILEYRKYSKLLNTYIESIPKLRDKENRIHTSFNQIGTVTGRLSSSDPNLQNIPAKTDEGMKIRAGFVATPGYKLMGIDYSQIELRVLATMSKDENLIKAYQNDADLHSLTARNIFDIEDDGEVTREQRTIGKTINFSVIYGKTAYGLSKELNITPKEAGTYIDKYFAKYPKVKEFEQKIIDLTEKCGYTETLFGRRRIIDGINSQNKNIKNQAERMAVNSVIQGTAAEIIKKVMIKVYEFIKNRDDIFLLLQVHDELIFEIKEDKISEYRETIENIMENTVTFEDVPLKINTNIGINWADTK